MNTRANCFLVLVGCGLKFFVQFLSISDWDINGHFASDFGFSSISFHSVWRQTQCGLLSIPSLVHAFVKNTHFHCDISDYFLLQVRLADCQTTRDIELDVGGTWSDTSGHKQSLYTELNKRGVRNNLSHGIYYFSPMCLFIPTSGFLK